jgi:hypothetical protein
LKAAKEYQDVMQVVIVLKCTKDGLRMVGGRARPERLW